MPRTKLWLDCDPGHDDAIALLLALHSPEVELLGVSTVHGNASALNTHHNACRLLHAYGAPSHVNAYPGAAKPLLRAPRADPEIHGDDGLGGVEGLPSVDHPDVATRIQEGSKTRALEAMACAISKASSAGEKVAIITTGPMTNLALFASVYPDLIKFISRIVFMGGGVGMGNRGAVSEYNILCDPEAVQIVLDVSVEKVMIPINVTHTAIFEHFYHSMLLDPNTPPHFSGSQLPKAASPFRHTISTLLTFFAETYKSTFGFSNGPPLHDALTVAYIVKPEIFKAQRFRVDVELTGTHSLGETVVDTWNYSGSQDNLWGTGGKNCLVTQSLQERLSTLHSIDGCA